MTNARLRLPDVQRLRSFEVDNDWIRGALLRPNAKNPRGQPRPRACPRMGATGSTVRIIPLLDFHASDVSRRPRFPAIV